MAGATQPQSVLDALYGRISFEQPFAALIAAPIAQRMRHVRLSNIDSVDLPSIANLSRYEHVLGVAHLAGLVGFRPVLSSIERFALDAAALLHDWAITSFGHLVEEAFQFVGAKFEHEKHLAALAAGESSSDILGRNRQILGGREPGLEPWIMKVTSSRGDGECLLAAITDYIRGRGKYGQIICGTIDLDNIDNVTRMAYHLGLVRHGEIAARLASAMIGVDEESGAPVFLDAAISDIAAWLEMRRDVYNLLMLSEKDFAGKLMLIYATVKAFQGGELTTQDWAMADGEFFERLRKSEVQSAAEAATRWYVGELWDMAPLSWFSGSRPDYPYMMSFSEALSDHMGRSYFAYAIKDKRQRKLTLHLAGHGQRTFGTDSDQWLLGFGSPVRQTISKRDADRAWAFAESYFKSRRLGDATDNADQAKEFAWLI